VIVLVCGNFSDCYSIESEISNNRENRKVVINLGIESVSCDIEIIREYFYEENRNKRSRYFSSDLSNSIGIDFFGCQEKTKKR